jgi:IPT/TIG domain
MHFNVVSDTQITVVSPTGNSMVDVIVKTPGGTSTTSAADQFIYIPTPIVTSISPTSGIDTGGTTVIITGSNFNSATKVLFDGNAAKSFTIDSNTQITAVSPAGCYNCAIDVTVTTPGGTSATSSSDQFFYYPPIQ